MIYELRIYDAMPGKLPALNDRHQGNLKFNVDFRRVYATTTAGWLGYPDTLGLLGEEFAPFPMFA